MTLINSEDLINELKLEVSMRNPILGYLYIDTIENIVNNQKPQDSINCKDFKITESSDDLKYNRQLRDWSNIKPISSINTFTEEDKSNKACNP